MKMNLMDLCADESVINYKLLLFRFVLIHLALLHLIYCRLWSCSLMRSFCVGFTDFSIAQTCRSLCTQQSRTMSIIASRSLRSILLYNFFSLVSFIMIFEYLFTSTLDRGTCRYTNGLITFFFLIFSLS